MAKKGEQSAEGLQRNELGAEVAPEGDFYDPVAADEAALRVGQTTSADVVALEQADAGLAEPDAVETTQSGTQQEPQQPQQTEPAQQADLNLDEIDFASMPVEERREFARRLVATDEGLDALINGYLRHSDYTRKQQERSERERQLDAREQQLTELAERIEKALTQRPANGETSLKPPAGLDMMAYVDWFERNMGRRPTQAEWQQYHDEDLLNRIDSLLEERIGPVVQRTEQQQLQAMVERFERQFADLQQKYPLARQPGVMEAIAQELDRINSDVEDAVALPDGTRVSAVEKAFLALYGPSLLRSQQVARQQQAQQTQQEVNLPPSGAEVDDLQAELAAQDDGSIEAVAEMQKRDRSLLQRVVQAMRQH